MVSYTVTTITTATTIVGGAHPIAARDLAHAVGVEIDWVVQLVEFGIVHAQTPGASPDDWRFYSADLQSALEAKRLERDFGVNLDTAALILDLQHEVRRLKGVLRVQGL